VALIGVPSGREDGAIVGHRWERTDDVQDGTSGSFGGSRPAAPDPGDPAEAPVPEQVRALLAAARELSDACADLADALRPAPAPGADPLTMDFQQLRAERTADLLDEAASISRGTFGLLDSAYAALTDQHTPPAQRPRPPAPTPARPDLVTHPIPVGRPDPAAAHRPGQPVTMWTPVPSAGEPGSGPVRRERSGVDLFAAGPPVAPTAAAAGPDRPGPRRPVPGPPVPEPAPIAVAEPAFEVAPVPAVTTPDALTYALEIGPVPAVSTPAAIVPVPAVTAPEPLTYTLAIGPVPAVSAPAAIITPPEPEPGPYEVTAVPAVGAVPPIIPVRALPDPATSGEYTDTALEELFLLAADPAGPMARRAVQPEEPDVAEPAETPEPAAAQWPATWSEPGAAARPPVPPPPIPAPRDSTWPDAFVEQKTRTDLPVPAAFAQPPRYEPAEAGAQYQTNPRGHYEDFLPAEDPRPNGNGATVTPLPAPEAPPAYGVPAGSAEGDPRLEDPASPADLAVLARQIEAARRHLQAAIVVGHKIAATLPPEAGLGVVEQLLADLAQVARAARESMTPGLMDRSFPGEARFLCALPWERACLVSDDNVHEPAAPGGLAKLLSALGYDAETTSGVGGARGVAVHSPRYEVHIALVEPAGGGRQRWSGALEWVDPGGVTRTWAETLGPVELDEEELARRVDELVRRCVGSRA
jgi:hypothetical protein